MQSLRVQNSIVTNLRSRLTDVPFVFENLRVIEERRPEGFRFCQFALSAYAELNGVEVNACGEGTSQGIAEAKLFSELIERAALISFGSQFSAETSNGWAAHPDKVQARINTICELVERDAVLAQWYCAEPFAALDVADLPLDIQKWAASDLSRSEFPRLIVLLSTKGIGPSVTCVFANDQGFGVCAHATRLTLADSIRSAVTEACRAAQGAIRRENWKDTLKLKAGISGKIGPGAHALYHAYHASFPEWMFGESVTWKDAENVWNSRLAPLLESSGPFDFQRVMEQPLFVGFATHPDAIPLCWGSTDEAWLANLRAARRLNLKRINKEPHIVA